MTHLRGSWPLEAWAGRLSNKSVTVTWCHWLTVAFCKKVVFQAGQILAAFLYFHFLWAENSVYVISSAGSCVPHLWAPNITPWKMFLDPRDIKSVPGNYWPTTSKRLQYVSFRRRFNVGKLTDVKFWARYNTLTRPPGTGGGHWGGDVVPRTWDHRRDMHSSCRMFKNQILYVL